MALDINAWNTFIQTGVSSDGAVKSSANGAPQLQVYPSPNLAPGNFGMLSLDDSSNSSSAISGWISNGLTDTEITDLNNSNLMPLPQPNPNLWDWKGAPGFKSSDLNSLPVGQTFLLPVFEPVVGMPGATYEAAIGATYQSTDKSVGGPDVGDGGVGQNAYYNILKFVGVQITQLDKSTGCPDSARGRHGLDGDLRSDDCRPGRHHQPAHHHLHDAQADAIGRCVGQTFLSAVYYMADKNVCPTVSTPDARLSLTVRNAQGMFRV